MIVGPYILFIKSLEKCETRLKYIKFSLIGKDFEIVNTVPSKVEHQFDYVKGTRVAVQAISVIQRFQDSCGMKCLHLQSKMVYGYRNLDQNRLKNRNRDMIEPQVYLL